MDRYTKAFVVASLVWFATAAGIGVWMAGMSAPDGADFAHVHFNLLGFMAKAFELEVICKDGTKRFVEASTCLMRELRGQPIGFCGISHDVTERKQAEEQERNLRLAKDKALNHLSHELRTPLSVIQGNIRILKRNTQAKTPLIASGEIFDILEKNLGRLLRYPAGGRQHYSILLGNGEKSPPRGT